jgi:hypothetical protein
MQPYIEYKILKSLTAHATKDLEAHIYEDMKFEIPSFYTAFLKQENKQRLYINVLYIY